MERFGILDAIRRHLAERVPPPDFGVCGAGFEHRDGDSKVIALQNVIRDVVGDDGVETPGSENPGDDRRVTFL